MADSYNFQSLQDGEYDPANTAPYENGNNYEDDDDDEEEEEEEEDDYDPSNLHFGHNAESASHQQQEHLQPEADVEMGAPEFPAEPEPTTQSTVSSNDTQKSPVITQAPSKQRTVGGFVVDDDDEDDEDIPMAGTSGQLNEAGDDTPQRSGNQTPINTLPLPDTTSIDKAAQEHGPSDSSGAAVPLDSAAPNGAAQVSTSSTSSNAGVPPSQTSFPVPSPAAASKAPVTSSSSSSVPLPKARLPQDKVGIFEDRIADDPRGDVDAWMSLINEHQRRSKFDDARAVYERFFQVFPFAVSSNVTEWCFYILNHE
jgi:cleavage stimulation factor subunit 3